MRIKKSITPKKPSKSPECFPPIFYEMDRDRVCSHCDSILQTDRERRIGVCHDCRRIALTTGHWPVQIVQK